MIMTNKLLPVALIAALIGGSVGAFVMHSRNQPTTADLNGQETAGKAADYQNAKYQPGKEQFIPAEFNTAPEQSAYKTGFADGFNACTQPANNRTGLNSAANVPARYRSGTRTSSRRVYYDYRQPRGRSFWQKHRDKLTVAMGTGGGALLGGLIGNRRY